MNSLQEYAAEILSRPSAAQLHAAHGKKRNDAYGSLRLGDHVWFLLDGKFVPAVIDTCHFNERSRLETRVFVRSRQRTYPVPDHIAITRRI